MSLSIKKNIVLIIWMLPLFVFAQSKIEKFSLREVELLNSPFSEAQKVDLNYILSLDPDRLLAPFLREAGFDYLNKSILVGGGVYMQI